MCLSLSPGAVAALPVDARSTSKGEGRSGCVPGPLAGTLAGTLLEEMEDGDFARSWGCLGEAHTGYDCRG